MTISMMRRPWLVGAAVALALLTEARAQETESLVIDPTTGNYILTYCCHTDGSMAQTTLEPATKVTPVVTSKLEAQSSDYIKYSFDIYVAPTSRKALEAFRLDPVSSVRSDVPVPARRSDVSRADWATAKQSIEQQMVSPQGWQPAATLSNKSPGLRLSWRRPAFIAEPAAPGTRHQGFGFESRDLPGVASAQFTSPAGVWAFSNEGPDRAGPVGHQLTQLQKNDFVARFVAAPTIAVPNPLNVAALLQKLRDHVAGWPQQQLMEQGFWQQIDSLLAGATSAANTGDKTTAGTKLAQIRVELRAKYPDLDATTALEDPTVSSLSSGLLPPAQNARDQRLAARILDFDVDYVVRRLGLPSPPSEILPIVDTDGPAIPMVPSTNTQYTPMVDFDGAFTVSWSTPLLVNWVGSASVQAVHHYEVDIATNSTFLNAIKIDAGHALSYKVENLASGKYFIRVLAWTGRGDNCSGCWADSPERTEAYTGPGVTLVVKQVADAQ